MARESFEDDEIAAIMNTFFVPVKIDREERPDLDMVYMQAVQLITGRGGWPLHCFALPDGRPFFGGTYFPPETWKSMLTMIHDLWETDRPRVLHAGEEITRGVEGVEIIQPDAGPSRESDESLREAVNLLSETFDTRRGGRLGMPKFPMPGLLVSLLEYEAFSGDDTASGHINLTLRSMARGGIYDHLGGGFARYSTDEGWHIPHFEKMLYDNAQLIELYAKAYLRNPDPLYKTVVRRTMEFCRRELLHPDGGFYSSLDADSEGEEGRYYTWTLGEVRKVLGKEADLWCDYYSITSEGNWEKGRNIPVIRKDIQESVPEHGRTPEATEARIEESSARLLEVRRRREAPARDDKVLTAWNALMIKACAWAYLAFTEDDYLLTALGTANFIEKNLIRSRGGIYSLWARGSAAVPGFASDYALLADAYLELYEAAFDLRWLRRAEELCRFMIDHFSDTESPLFLFCSREEPRLFAAKTELSDNVVPSSNAVAAEVLLRLAEHLHKEKYRERAQAMIAPLRKKITGDFGYFYRWASAWMRDAAGIITISASGPEAGPMLAALKKRYIPKAIFRIGEPAESSAPAGGPETGGRTRIIVCREKTCAPPAYSLEEALHLITERNP
jgi:hypothetical protein